ncbi:hypothetical protein CLOSTMETH_03038 [[Clostridium] methylpentosum DSM 5476]|uniref:Uncharacterized protein n=1 Tax=[Clostridium] methylpentosum DSM 5476 TaxID=537013 RepID=C0EGP5_9FIRM|nr:hypothetical protein CLOSTMETH_03038 [[Clostridium] methylpentosum DSM 5476]
MKCFLCKGDMEQGETSYVCAVINAGKYGIAGRYPLSWKPLWRL